jgi:hypothetical protein
VKNIHLLEFLAKKLFGAVCTIINAWLSLGTGFVIYRKSTTTYTVIHSTSNHLTQHNQAEFRSMVNILLNIPLKKN